MVRSVDKKFKTGFFGVGMGWGSFFLTPLLNTLDVFSLYSTPFSHLAPRKVVPDDEGKASSHLGGSFWLTNTGRWLGGG